MSSASRPADHQQRIEVWYAYPDAISSAQVLRLATLLSADELERAGRFYFDKDRRSFIVTRALLRLSLSRYASRPPGAWVFSLGPHGKPFIRNDGTPRLEFNVSHTQGLSVCTVADRDVGIDVESNLRDAALEVMDGHFSPEERADVLSRSAAERTRRFFQYWTLKEAYLKARGVGLLLPLQQVSYSLQRDAPRLDLGPACQDDASRWSVESWPITSEHQAALVIERDAVSPPEQRLRVSQRWGLPDIAEPFAGSYKS